MARILVVEDNTELREDLEFWLTGDEHEVDAFCDGNDAAKRLTEADYDLLILDWDLPGKHGIEICREYRDQGGLSAVLMLTGRGTGTEKEQGLDAGADDYLTKPFDLQELSARVRALLRRVERSGKLAAKKAPPKLVEMMVCPRCGTSFSKDATICDTCNVDLKLRILDENIGTTIGGRYEIMSVIARGGGGSVYLGRQKLMKRTIAIKLLLEGAGGKELLRKRFEREAEASGRLDHPNIATVHDFGVTDDDRPFLIMSYIDGYSLHEVMEAEVILEWRRAVNLFKQVCAAHDHAHKHGVVHRDLKPANIMVERVGTADEFVKLVDFGIAKLKPIHQEEMDKLTRDGDIFGTFEYMSPEQCLGKEPDHRSDIYSLGCVMYEVITGMPAIHGSNPLDTIQEHLDTIPTPCRQTRPELELPEALDRIVCRCLAKDPAERFQSAAELASALNQLA
jgi:DNA-binding response OmpR family regulator/tRNA A-37 threonylcarbamoyl transferase component Bud32